MAEDNSTTKQCTQCLQYFPDTQTYFYHATPNGRLMSRCKSCIKKEGKAWRTNNRERANINQRKYRVENPGKTLGHSRNAEKRRDKTKRSVQRHEKRMANIEEVHAKEHETREKNKDKINERQRHNYVGNKDKANKRNKNYRESNVERIRERLRVWRKNNPEIIYVNNTSRKARRLGLPRFFHKKHADFARQYWHGACAICGTEAEFWRVIAFDHWIPITDSSSPGHVPWNLIPMCHPKKGIPFPGISCNSSKSNKDPAIWLTAKLGPRKAKAKLKEIEVFFAAASAFAAQQEQGVAG